MRAARGQGGAGGFDFGGVDLGDIFGDMLDIERFKESIKQFNRVEGVGSLRDIVKTDPKGLEKEQIVQIVALTLNPNHFHFLG
jgi:hypothetical protein